MLTQWKDAPPIYFQFCRVDPRDWLDFNQRGKHFRFRGRSLKRLDVLAICEFLVILRKSSLFGCFSTEKDYVVTVSIFNSNRFMRRQRNDVNMCKYILQNITLKS